MLAAGQFVWPKWEFWAYWRGVNMLKNGQNESALSYLDAQIRRYPNNEDLYSLAARSARALGLHDLARSRLSFAAAISATPGIYRLDLGLQFLRMGRLVDAQSELEAAFEDDPNHPVCRYNLALIARNQSDYERANELIGPLIDGETVYGRAYLLAAVCAYETHRYQEAIRYAKNRLEQRPKDGPAHEILGRAYEAIGRIDDAVAHLKNAIQINEENGRLKRRLGRLILSADFENGRRYLRDALLADTPDYRAHRDLALCYADQKHMNRAWSEYRLFVQHCPDSNHEIVRQYIAGQDGGNDV